MKVAVNKCYGGFSLSSAAFEELVGMTVDEWYSKEWGAKEWADHKKQSWSSLSEEMHRLPDGMERHDPRLIALIEKLGSGHGTGASGRCANLEIIEIPDGVDYEIDEYDGMESIHEKHRSWA